MPATGDWTVSQVCEKTVAFLEEVEPELFAVWVREMALQTLQEFLRKRQASQRTKWRQHAKGRVFADRVAEFEADGDPEHLSIFDQSYVVNAEQIRRRMADMTGADHLFVAKNYEQSAEKQAMLAAFHRKVAQMVGERRTADVLDEETLERIYQSIS